MDFRSYPFEKLLLTIEVEGIDDVNKVVFYPDTIESGIDYFVNIPG